MVIEKLRENARREAAEAAAMAGAKKATAGRVGLRPLKLALPSIDLVEHRVFVPALAIWGGVLGGLCVMMLSGLTVAGLAISVGLGAFGSLAHPALGVIAAVIGGGIAWIGARMLRARVQRAAIGGPAMETSVAAMAARRVQPIDPSSELGSDSLDAPIEEIPFSRSRSEGDAPQDGGDEGEHHATDIPPELLAGEGDLFELDAAAEIDSDAWVDFAVDTGVASGVDSGVADGPEEPAVAQAGRRISSAGPFDPTPAKPTHHSSVDPAGEAETTADYASTPREMGLGEFAGLARRRGVWVSDEPETSGDPDLLKSKPQWVEDAQLAAEPKAEPEAEPALEPVSGRESAPERMEAPQPLTHSLARAHANDARTAIEKLREVPPQELSLVQMVERFAAALHENQETARKLVARGRPGPSTPPRDAALAEALKALALFTERGFDADASGLHDEQPIDMVGETERELRNALAKLQTLRGAA